MTNNDDNSPLHDRLNYVENRLDGHKDWIELYGKTIDQMEAKYQALRDHKASKASYEMLSTDMKAIEAKTDELCEYAKTSSDSIVEVDEKITRLEHRLDTNLTTFDKILDRLQKLENPPIFNIKTPEIVDTQRKITPQTDNLLKKEKIIATLEDLIDTLRKQ